MLIRQLTTPFSFLSNLFFFVSCEIGGGIGFRVYRVSFQSFARKDCVEFWGGVKAIPPAYH